MFSKLVCVVVVIILLAISSTTFANQPEPVWQGDEFSRMTDSLFLSVQNVGYRRMTFVATPDEEWWQILPESDPVRTFPPAQGIFEAFSGLNWTAEVRHDALTGFPLCELGFQPILAKVELEANQGWTRQVIIGQQLDNGSAYIMIIDPSLNVREGNITANHGVRMLQAGEESMALLLTSLEDVGLSLPALGPLC